MSVVERVEVEALPLEPLVLPIYVPEMTFGWSALRDYTLQQMTSVESAGHDQPETVDVMASLSSVRKSLLADKHIIPKYLDHNLNTLLKGSVFDEWAKPHKKAGSDWRDILANKFSPSQLLSFIEWNMTFTADAQASFEHKLPEVVLRYVDRIEQGIQAGWLPAHVRDRLVLLNNVQFYVGDIFSTEAQNTCGFYYGDGNDDDGPQIIVSALSVEDPDELEAVLFHEMTHALTGTGWWDQVMHKEIWLNEAMTEHITEALLGEAAFGDLKKLHGDYYVAERKLLREVTKRLSSEWLLDLYFTDESEQHGYIGASIDNIFVNTEYYDKQIKLYDKTKDDDDKMLIMKQLTNFLIMKNLSYRAVQTTRR